MAANLLVFDVETYRTRVVSVINEITCEALEKRPAQNAAKEIKAAWDTAEARMERVQSAISKTAVDVTLAEPLSAAFRLDHGEIVKRVIGFEPDLEQKNLALLSEEWSDCTDANTVWGGHNIEGFDLAVLLNRMRRHKVRPPAHFPMYRHRRWRGRIFDSMRHMPTSNGLDFIAVDVACARYGVPFPRYVWRGREVDGSMVGEMFAAGPSEWPHILGYNGCDVEGEDNLIGAMTFDGTWGWYERADVYEQVSEIRAADHLSDAQRAIALVKALEGAGVI